MVGIIIILICIILGTWCLERMKIRFPYFKEFILFLLVVFAGLRYNVGVDYPIYEDIFNDPYSVHALAIEPIWLGINKVLRALGMGVRVFFFLTSWLVVWGFYIGIRKMSFHFYISILLFVLCGFYFESMNIVRQYVAVSLLFVSFSYFVEKKSRKYFLCVLCAILFHYSVLVILPLIWISRFKYPVWLLIITLFVSAFYGKILFNLIVEYIMPSFTEIGYYQYGVEDFDSGVSSGVLRLFYNLFGIFILSLYAKQNQIHPYLHILVNMFVMGLLLYNIFYLFMPARRLYHYFFPYLILLFPYYLRCFNRISQVIILTGTCLVFGIFLAKSNWDVLYNFDFSFF
ncbi:EpsG family protein [Bacteroides thetaiotaomicron]|uniref:EpsG family protein n=1 Tax=Bacteroides thetaiotaomicron TaxID=818 RepID=UPI0021660098|nr:EpsG family protein [Bacteroides thetaiotaomicron]MCS2714474.1 EpsG family protein [Bacteroides thetaiotaomicron]MCS2874716.1 EpsG family protein [Bacteroides thetaiotaomicron]MDC2010585.1 EpsG family protein [Bacteroides thetaiotaomicron]MDC2023963.1 EpsG family protein [Bacteroides thetaiotaomicron]MDC2028293.1 EpsG family protein [Bacteroides thetaiotaomicron]